MKQIFFIALILLLSLTSLLELKAKNEYPKINLEANLAYDHLTPTTEFEDWKGLELRYQHMFNGHNTMVLSSNGIIRDVSSLRVQAALYRDWLKQLYTYSSASMSSKTEWNGRFRLDDDINFKFGSKLQYILTLGQTGIFYPEDRSDLLLSIGGVVYMPHTVTEGRYFFNKSEPGSIWSNTLRLAFSWGTMGKYWATILGSTGAQAYEEVIAQLPTDQKVKSIGLNQQFWLDPDKGIKIGLGYLKVEDGFEKFNVTLGYFHQLR